MSGKNGALIIFCLIFSLFGCSKDKPDNQSSKDFEIVKQENNIDYEVLLTQETVKSINCALHREARDTISSTSFIFI